MLSKKKKFVILGVMVVLLVVTGYLNIVLNNRTVDVDSNVTSKGSFFATYRDDRQTIRDKEILFYDAIVSSETSSSEAKTIAEQNKLNLIQMMEKELIMEGLIKAKGFEDVVVSSSNTNINVAVKSSELKANEVAQIVAIVSSQTGKTIDNINIIPV